MDRMRKTPWRGLRLIQYLFLSFIFRGVEVLAQGAEHHSVTYGDVAVSPSPNIIGKVLLIVEGTIGLGLMLFFFAFALISGLMNLELKNSFLFVTCFVSLFLAVLIFCLRYFLGIFFA